MPDRPDRLHAVSDADTSLDVIPAEAIAALVRGFESKHSGFPALSHMAQIGTTVVRVQGSPSSSEAVNSLVTVTLNRRDRAPRMTLEIQCDPRGGFHISRISFTNGIEYLRWDEDGNKLDKVQSVRTLYEGDAREIHPERHTTLDLHMIERALEILGKYLATPRFSSSHL